MPAVPTFNLQFRKKFWNEEHTAFSLILQQRWDTSRFAEGKWEITSEWKDVTIEGDGDENTKEK